MITVLMSPVITEKSMYAAAHGVYTFAVPVTATKSQVAAAVAKEFKVKVTGIATKHLHVPAKRSGSRRLLGTPSKAKQALVTLAKGQTIALFEMKEEK